MKMAAFKGILNLITIYFSLISGDVYLKDSFNKTASPTIALILTTWSYRDAVHAGKYYKFYFYILLLVFLIIIIILNP